MLAIGYLARNYDVLIPADRMECFRAALADFEMGQIEAGVKRACRECPRLPNPAQLRDLAKAEAQRRAAELCLPPPPRTEEEWRRAKEFFRDMAGRL